MDKEKASNNRYGSNKMEVECTLRHSNVHKSTRDLVMKEVEVFNKYYSGAKSCRIILDYQENDKEESKIAEIYIRVKGKSFFSKSRSDTYEKAIGKCVASISRKLRQHNRIVKGL